jgi:hypothetical protein
MPTHRRALGTGQREHDHGQDKRPDTVTIPAVHGSTNLSTFREASFRFPEGDKSEAARHPTKSLR